MTPEQKAAMQAAIEAALDTIAVSLSFGGGDPGPLAADLTNRADAIHAALAQPDVESTAYGYACRLAFAIWESHYKDRAPNWKPLPDLIGVLTQIDNMTNGLAAAPARKPLLASDIVCMYAERPTSDAEMIEFARAIERAHGIGGDDGK